jgi:hypothetical protein
LVSLREATVGGWYVPSYPSFVLFSKFSMLLWWSRSSSNGGRREKEKIFTVLVHGGLDLDLEMCV